MPLPYDALFELLRLVLFVYTGGEDDAERLLKLSSMFGDSLAATPDGIKGSDNKQRDWQLRRLVDLCLQCSTASSTEVEVSTGFKAVRALAETLPEMQQYLRSDRLVVCHPPKAMRKMQYHEMPRASVTQIVREGLISARRQLPTSTRAKELPYCNALLDFVVNSLPFWAQKKPNSNQLLVRSVEAKTDIVVLNEVQLLSKLLQSVPPATYAASGVAISWTKVSESHSVPVVFPEALNEQLQILVNDQYLRSMWLRRRRENDEDSSSVGGTSQLLNTSKQARHIASNGVDRASSMLSMTTQRKATLALSKSTEPFILENIKALSCLCGTFLFRWGSDGGKRQSYAMRLLNTLAFYHVEVVEGEEIQNVSLVRMLWCVLQDIKNFEDYVKMYEKEYPLPLCQIERVVLSLKHALHEAYWTYANLAPSSESVAFGMFVVEMATRLMRVLYNRCSRQPFCNVTSWYVLVVAGVDTSIILVILKLFKLTSDKLNFCRIIPELNSNQLIEEVLLGTPRANKLIQSMPYLVPFPDRVKLFQRLIKADKEIHQSESCSVYRIRIHRGAILEDGLRKLNSIRTNLKKRINVVFVNSAGREEVGIDAGGLFKEFWLDLSTLAFDLQYGLFLTTHDQLLYPNPNSASNHFSRESDHLTMFQFVGRILGKALYEGIVVQPKFAHFFLSKLLHSFNHLNELPSLDPEIYKSYEGDVEDLGLTHTVVQDVFGEQKEVEIIPGGGNVPVTNRNKTRYIHLVANYYLNTQIREQCAAFRMGLSDLIDPRWLQMFNEPELQVLISGKSGKIDVDDLKANARYAGGYYALDKRVAWLWQALASFTPSEQAAFLRFTTSCQRAPSLGFASLTPQFCVQKIPIRSDDELLPSSSTCFNTLKLPTYSSYKVLRAKLLTSISSGAGFEMT
ncbi:unnamed protein product [Phytophthora fragariaefolia]|uniref:HECT-type E3 ubiquitin transferase n=1 Tax=Phytophthora fragariaefolia TaxID=1490495 RepID=A0A9W7D1U4_9STRA|nr:unnamed protein product [Phytophthora fragariaefolia]